MDSHVEESEFQVLDAQALLDEDFDQEMDFAVAHEDCLTFLGVSTYE